jgi:L-amino acid N-acyltransferase YncA
MSSNAMIRLASPADADGVLAIYAPVVRETPISFEWDPPTATEMRDRIEHTLQDGLPWLVCATDDRCLGYAYAARHKARAAYRWSVEVSVYIHPLARRQGVGQALYTSLFAILELQRFVNVYAGATLPNPGSVGLHTAVGFREIGVYTQVGFKHGAWHDVIWWHRPLGAHSTDPAPPLPLAQAQASPAWAAALAAGLHFLTMDTPR